MYWSGCSLYMKLFLHMLSQCILTESWCYSAWLSHPQRCHTLYLSSPSSLCLPNKLSLSPFSPPWQVSSSTAASLKTTRSDSRETGESRLHNKDLLWWWNVLQGPKHPLRKISPSDKARLTLAPEPWAWGRRRDPKLIGSAAWGRGRVTKSNSRQAAVMHN